MLAVLESSSVLLFDLAPPEEFWSIEDDAILSLSELIMLLIGFPMVTRRDTLFFCHRSKYYGGSTIESHVSPTWEIRNDSVSASHRKEKQTRPSKGTFKRYLLLLAQCYEAPMRIALRCLRRPYLDSSTMTFSYPFHATIPSADYERQMPIESQ